MNDDALKFLFERLIECDSGWYGYTIQKAHDYVSSQQLQHSFAFPHELSLLEVSIINYYKSQNSWRINQNLRSLSHLGKTEYLFNEYYVALLNACLDKIPRHSNSTVWRLERHTNDDHQNILNWYTKHIGKYIKFPQFLSCTKNIDDVDKPMSTIFKIKSSDETRLHDIGDLVKVYKREDDWESEAIYKTGSAFKIKGVVNDIIILAEVKESDIASSTIITIANENYWE